MKKICVLGLGYIGLPTSVLIAQKFDQVIGVDNNANIVKSILDGKPHIVEPGLSQVLNKVQRKGSLTIQTKPVEADVFILAVPTPLDKKYNPDVSFVVAAVLDIAPFLKNGNLLIIESTCPVGTTERIVSILKETRTDLCFDEDKIEHEKLSVAYCPERVIPGNTLHELVYNDRIMGGYSPSCAYKAKSFYQHFVTGSCIVTNARTAEMAKLTENAFRDVNIAFANEISMICDDIDINVWELRRLTNKHPRVQMLSPGPGVGGHCIAVDPYFIISQSPHISNLLSEARIVNQNKEKWVIDRVYEYLNNLKLNKPKVACLGLAYKADVDDLRESPALRIAQFIHSQIECETMFVEPNLTVLDVKYGIGEKLHEVHEIVNADLVLILVDHKEFMELDEYKIDPAKVFDTRGCFKF